MYFRFSELAVVTPSIAPLTLVIQLNAVSFTLDTCKYKSRYDAKEAHYSIETITLS